MAGKCDTDESQKAHYHQQQRDIVLIIIKKSQRCNIFSPFRTNCISQLLTAHLKTYCGVSGYVYIFMPFRQPLDYICLHMQTKEPCLSLVIYHSKD